MADDFDPDAYLKGNSAPTEFDPDAYLQQGKKPSLAEHAIDVGKQAGAGIMSGLAGGLNRDEKGKVGSSWLRRAGEAQLEAENLTGQPAPKAADYEQAAAKALPEPIGMPGRITRAATESLPLSVATGLPPTPASLALQGASAGVEQGVGEKYGALAGAAAGIGTSLAPGVVSGLRRLIGRHMDYRGAPMIEELADSYNGRYAAARDLGVELDPTSVSKGIKEIKDGIEVHPENAEKTFKLLNQAEKEHAPRQPTHVQSVLGIEPGEKELVSFDKLDSLRRNLNDVWKNARLRGEGDGSEAKAAKEAISGIDEFLLGGKFQAVKGNAQELGQIVQKARAERAAAFRLEAVNNVLQRAENTEKAGTVPFERALRTELKNFVRPTNKGRSPAMKEGLNSAEIEEFRKASHMGSIPYMLRALGIAGGFLGMGAGAYGTYHTGNPEWMAMSALGLGARKTNAMLMRARADRLQRMTAAHSPLGQELGVGPSAMTPKPGQNYSIYPFTEGIHAINSASGFKKGGRVTKTFRYCG